MSTACTFFPDAFAKTLTQGAFSSALLEDPPRAKTKAGLPFIKLAVFSGEKTKNNCCRHDKGVTAVTGCELDYDHGTLTINEAAARFEKAGVKAHLYPTPSNTEENPRWRGLLMFSESFRGTTDEMREYRKGAVRAAVEVLGEDVANESYTLSQSYYYGEIEGKNWFFIETEGALLDQVFDIASYEEASAQKAKLNGHEESLVPADAIRAIITGEEFHTSTIRLAARHAGRGMQREAILDILTGLMNASVAAGTDRWTKRMEELEAAVDSAVGKFAPIDVVATFASLADAPDVIDEPTHASSYRFSFPEGLVGDVGRFVMESSPVPNKPFAVMAGLLAVSVMSQNQYYIPPFNTRLNIYCAAVGATGSGKDDPPSKVNQLLHMAGLRDVTAEGISSGVALQRALASAPNKTMFYWQDEIWEMIQAGSQATGAPYKRELTAVLMTLFGRAGKFFGGRLYAKTSDNIAQIEKPYVVFGGATTEVRFMESLSDKHVADGFLNRLIVFQSDGVPDLTPPTQAGVPEALRERLKVLARTTVASINMSNLNETNARTMQDQEIAVKRDDGVDNYLREFSQYAKHVDGPFAALWSRAFENATKVAGILAVGVDPEKPVITMLQAEWAMGLVQDCLVAFGAQLDRHLADNAFHGLCNKGLELIRHPQKFAGDPRWGAITSKGLPRGIMLRSMHIEAAQMDRVIEYLTQTSAIETVDVDGVTVYRVRKTDGELAHGAVNW